jgi:hypothetical protein
MKNTPQQQESIILTVVTSKQSVWRETNTERWVLLFIMSSVCCIRSSQVQRRAIATETREFVSTRYVCCHRFVLPHKVTTAGDQVDLSHEAVIE